MKCFRITCQLKWILLTIKNDENEITWNSKDHLILQSIDQSILDKWFSDKSKFGRKKQLITEYELTN